jgi:alkanesulfonate monooxygenase SsuD/methylene tetrahydromethanopterin reductase-like flavin-dependent oxidoreductase (luciferase family)
VRLGPACPATFPVRSPLVFAYEWASPDRIVEGRTVLIVCARGGSAGDWEAETRAVDVPVAERQRRLYTRARIKTWHALGSPQECVESLRRFRGIGMEPITLGLTSWDQVGQLERVIREVLPYLNR